MPIRRVQPADLPAFLDLARAMHAEASQSALPLSERKLTGLFRAACDAANTTFIALATGRGEQEYGMIGGFLGTPYFAEIPIVFDLFLYVRPEKRGGLAAARLWRSLRDWAGEVGAAELSMGVSTGVAPERADRLYAGLGMQRMGSVYRLPLASARSGGGAGAVGARTS